MNATAINSILHVRTTQLFPHPDNRPLGINEEKVEQLAEMMRQNGYDQSKPLKVRPFHYSDNQNYEGYQIIEGEHRWRAAQKAGIDEVPVFVVDVDDEEALIQLVAGNVQTDNHPLDIGLAAMRVVRRHSKNGLDGKAFGERIGVNGNTINEYIRAARIYSYINEQNTTGRVLLEDASKLVLISRCKESDWLWFHDLIASKGLSKSDAIEISKRIRAIDAAAGDHSAKVFDLTEVKRTVADDTAKGKNRQYKYYLELIELIEQKAVELGNSWTLYKYGFVTKEVESYEFNPAEWFVSVLCELKSIDKSVVFEQYNNLLKRKRHETEEAAQADKEHYEQERNEEERKERLESERRSRRFQRGQWWQIGRHFIYHGDSSKDSFLNRLPVIDFGFADPPYNAGVDEWDSDFTWNHDWMSDKCKLVAVTPGLWDLSVFMKATNMPYQWSMAYWVNNGMGRGKMGLGNWNPILIFSNDSVHFKIQDFIQIPVCTSDGLEEPFKGRKPTNLMEEVIGRLTQENAIVCDPFLGSGTTLFVAEKLNRVCYGAEIEEKHFRNILERFEDENKVNALLWTD